MIRIIYMFLLLSLISSCAHFIAGPSCPETKLLSWASEKDMSEQDRWNYEMVKIRCPQKFKNSPCLISFEKRRHDAYHVICGKPR